MADTVLFRDQDGDTDEELSETNISQVLALTNISEYVDRGLGFTADFVNNTLNVGAGHAVLEGSNQAYHVLPDARTGLGLTDATTNYVYLQADTSDGSVSYHIDTDDSPPTGSNIISLKVGEADTSADTTTEVNRSPSDETGAFTAASIDDGDSPYTTQGEAIIFADTSSAAVEVELASADVEQGKQIVIIDDADNASTNNITVSTQGSETIDPDAEATKTIDLDGSVNVYRSNGTNWSSDRAADLDTADITTLSGGVVGANSVTSILGDGLEVASNTLRAALGDGLDFAAGSIQILDSIWDGTDLVADINNTNTVSENYNGADVSAATDGQALTKAATGSNLEFETIIGLTSAIENGTAYADDGNTYSTVQAAENAATDFMFIGPGTFSENVVVDTANLSIIGSGRGTVIDGTTGTAISIEAAGITIKNLAVQTTAGGGNTAYGIRGADTSSPDELLLMNIWVEESDTDGIRLGTDDSRVVSIYCDSANIDGSDVVLDNNSNTSIADDIIGTVVDNGTGDTVGETA